MSVVNHAFLDELDHYIKAKRYRLVNSVVVYENDRLVFERYYNKFTENTTNTLQSTWKSIVSLTLGICIDNGLVKSVDDPISRYLPALYKTLSRGIGISPFGTCLLCHRAYISWGVYITIAP